MNALLWTITWRLPPADGGGNGEHGLFALEHPFSGDRSLGENRFEAGWIAGGIGQDRSGGDADVALAVLAAPWIDVVDGKRPGVFLQLARDAGDRDKMGIQDDPLRCFARLAAQDVAAQAEHGRQAFGQGCVEPPVDALEEFLRSLAGVQEKHLVTHLREVFSGAHLIGHVAQIQQTHAAAAPARVAGDVLGRPHPDLADEFQDLFAVIPPATATRARCQSGLPKRNAFNKAAGPQALPATVSWLAGVAA